MPRLLLTLVVSSTAALSAPAERPFVPQLPEAWALWSDVEQHASLPLPATTVLLCRVTVPSLAYDTFAGADLRVALSVNGLSLGFANGPEDSDMALVSFPVSLAPGDRLSMTVWDRDFTGPELVGSSGLTAGKALPLAFVKAGFNATCGGVPEQMTRARQDDGLRRVDAALERLTPLPPVRLTEQNLGRPDRAFLDLEAAITAVGAWTPWRHPPLVERLLRAEALGSEWDRAVRDELARAREQLPLAGEPVVLQPGVVAATVGPLRCARGACTLALELTNLSADPLERSTGVPEEAFDRAQLLTSGGLLIELELAAPRSSPDAGRAPLPPGATANVTLPSRWSREAAPVLLRLRTPFGWKLLRLRDR